jgi:hypothetical protein
VPVSGCVFDIQTHALDVFVNGNTSSARVSIACVAMKTQALDGACVSCCETQAPSVLNHFTNTGSQY